MNVADLISDLSGRGVELAAEGAMLLYRPVDRLTSADLMHLREHKTEILRRLRVEEIELTPMSPDESDAANEFYWENLPDRDREYLTGPRVFPAPCPWCGGRYRHNRLCDALRASWEPTLPFGMHKGKPLSAVPREYLEWLVSCSDGISDELCESIKLRL